MYFFPPSFFHKTTSRKKIGALAISIRCVEKTPEYGPFRTSRVGHVNCSNSFSCFFLFDLSPTQKLQNNWKAPTYMASVENANLRGGGMPMKNSIWEAARPTIEEWTGMKLKPSSLYGIRVYTEGAILAPHVDRLPLVSSCIINVAQDVEEDWVLEVYDRQDRAVNVTMAPGDMVLYESGSLMHGRPFPLKGNFYANIFIHFEPTGEHLHGGGWDEIDDFYPPYLVPNSPELEYWARKNPSGWRVSATSRITKCDHCWKSKTAERKKQ